MKSVLKARGSWRNSSNDRESPRRVRAIRQHRGRGSSDEGECHYDDTGHPLSLLPSIGWRPRRRVRWCRRGRASGATTGTAERHARAPHRPRPRARRQSRRRFARSPGGGLSAAQLRQRHRAALPGALLPSRLHGDRGGLRQVTGHSRLDRSRRCRRRPRNDRRHTRRVHQVQRQHVFELADHRRLGDVHRPGSDDVHRQAVSHDCVARGSRSRRPLDGRIRHDAHRHETALGIRGAVRDELVLPDERSGRARRRAGTARRRSRAR